MLADLVPLAYMTMEISSSADGKRFSIAVHSLHFPN